MREYAFAGLTALALVFATASGSRAAPASADDLTGHTICWHNDTYGDCKTTFGAGGVFSSAGTSLLCGPESDGTWSVTPTGVQTDTPARHHINAIEKLADGTYREETKCGDITCVSTGKDCAR